MLAVILFWYTVPFAYATAVVFVLSVFALWPASRLPNPLIAALWGGASSYAATVLIFGSHNRDLLDAAILFSAAPGALSGLVYTWLVRSKTRKDEQSEGGAA
jgi:hypothetical protein